VCACSTTFDARPPHAPIHAYLNINVCSGTCTCAYDYFRVMCKYLFGFYLHRMLAPACTCSCIFTCICVFRDTYIWVLSPLDARPCMHVFMHTYMYMCTQGHVYVQTIISGLCVYIYLVLISTGCSPPACTCSCTAQIYMYLYTHIYICVYKYMHTCMYIQI